MTLPCPRSVRPALVNACLLVSWGAQPPGAEKPSRESALEMFLHAPTAAVPTVAWAAAELNRSRWCQEVSAASSPLLSGPLSKLKAVLAGRPLC